MRAFVVVFVLVAFALTLPASAQSNPYAHLPSVGDSVRFDGSVGGEKMAWAYPTLDSLEAYLRSTIDAAMSSTTYQQYAQKTGLVLKQSLTFDDATPGVVTHVQRFYYRDHEDVEVQVRVTSGSTHPTVWTTPAELVSAGGHRYLK